MIKSSFIPVTEHFTASNQSKHKKGKYHSSVWHFPEYGKKVWLIGVKILLDPLESSDIKIPENELEDFVDECLLYINKPNNRGRKPYGELSCYRAWKKDNGTIAALLKIDKHKHKDFWGEGPRNLNIK